MTPTELGALRVTCDAQRAQFRVRHPGGGA